MVRWITIYLLVMALVFLACQANADVRTPRLRITSETLTMDGSYGIHMNTNLGEVKLRWEDAGGNGYFSDLSQTSDHGALTGLADDDHAHYHTDGRHTTVHDAAYNDALPITADVDGNVALSDHMDDADLHWKDDTYIVRVSNIAGECEFVTINGAIAYINGSLTPADKHHAIIYISGTFDGGAGGGETITLPEFVDLVGVTPGGTTIYSDQDPVVNCNTGNNIIKNVRIVHESWAAGAASWALTINTADARIEDCIIDGGLSIVNGACDVIARNSTFIDHGIYSAGNVAFYNCDFSGVCDTSSGSQEKYFNMQGGVSLGLFNCDITVAMNDATAADFYGIYLDGPDAGTRGLDIFNVNIDVNNSNVNADTFAIYFNDGASGIANAIIARARDNGVGTSYATYHTAAAGNINTNAFSVLAGDIFDITKHMPLLNPVISADVIYFADGTEYLLDDNGDAYFKWIYIDQYIAHDGDTDTVIEFHADEDRMLFRPGGENLIDLTEAAQDYVKFGDGGDVDINFNDMMFMRGSDGQFGIGTAAPVALLHVDGDGVNADVRIKSITDNALIRMDTKTGGTANIYIEENNANRWAIGYQADDDLQVYSFGAAINAILIDYATGNMSFGAQVLYINYDGGDGDQIIYFYDGAAATGQSIMWDDAVAAGDPRFVMSAGLELTAGAFIGSTVVITQDDTTPDVSGGNLFTIPATWTGGNDITTFDDGVSGQTIEILGGDTDCNVIDGGALHLIGDWNGASDNSLTLVLAGAAWYEVARTELITRSIVLPAQALGSGKQAPAEVFFGDYVAQEYDIADNTWVTAEVPYDWAVGTDLIVKLCWFIDEAYAADKEVKWTVDWSMTPHDETELIDAPTHTGQLAPVTEDIPTDAKDLTIQTLGTIGAANLAAQDEIGLVLTRVLADNDDPTADPNAIHLEIEYTAIK